MVKISEARGNKYCSFEVRLKTEEQAKVKSTQQLKIMEWVWIPLCVGKSTSKIRMSDAPTETDIEKVMASSGHLQTERRNNDNRHRRLKKSFLDWKASCYYRLNYIGNLETEEIFSTNNKCS